MKASDINLFDREPGTHFVTAMVPLPLNSSSSLTVQDNAMKSRRRFHGIAAVLTLLEVVPYTMCLVVTSPNLAFFSLEEAHPLPLLP